MRTTHGATHRPIHNDGRRSHSRWVDPRVGYVHPRHRSDPRAGYTHTAHAVCAWGWGPGTMRSSHGATSVQSATVTTAGCSHSRWVDPHMSYVHPHHRSDPRAGYMHTAHAVCAWGWAPGTMRSSHGATSVESATTAGCGHSRRVDPHRDVSFVQAHHRSDPRAGCTHSRAEPSRVGPLGRPTAMFGRARSSSTQAWHAPASN